MLKVEVVLEQVEQFDQEVESSGRYRSWREVGGDRTTKKPSSFPMGIDHRRVKMDRPLVGSRAVGQDQSGP